MHWIACWDKVTFFPEKLHLPGCWCFLRVKNNTDSKYSFTLIIENYIILHWKKEVTDLHCKVWHTSHTFLRILKCCRDILSPMWTKKNFFFFNGNNESKKAQNKTHKITSLYKLLWLALTSLENSTMLFLALRAPDRLIDIILANWRHTFGCFTRHTFQHKSLIEWHHGKRNQPRHVQNDPRVKVNAHVLAHSSEEETESNGKLAPNQHGLNTERKNPLLQ